MLREVFKNRSQLHLAQGLSAGSVDARSRVSFYYAFGILPDHQLAMERFYHQATIGPLVATAIDREWLVVSPGVNVVTESN
jgi:hypothetical protein